jgi:RNA polymerase sigma-70 factor, ECF subfamily
VVAFIRSGILDREAPRVIACNETRNAPVSYEVSLDSAANSAAVAGFRRSQLIPFRPRPTVPLQCAAEGARLDRAHPGPLMIESGRGEATEEQLARLLESFRADLMRFAFWLSRDRSIAEDVVQETMLRAWRARNELRNTTAVRPWLLTIVRRENARLYERKRLPTVDLNELIANQDVALALNDTDPEIADLRRAILALPDEYREPIVLQVLGGFSTGEIAKELDLTVPAVLTRLFRARNKLREMYGVGPASAEDAP